MLSSRIRLAMPFAFAQLLAVVSAQSLVSVQSGLVSATITGMATATAIGTSAEASPSSTGQAVHLVKVGAGGFQFEPANLTSVQVGDVVTFEFYPPDHSVARAEFKSPCIPYEYTGKDKKGFWSDVQIVDTVNDITHWNLTINSTEPIFYYCAALGSCLDHLMVGVINPNDTQTLEAQIKAAEDATIMVKPGDQIPKEGSATLQLPDATSSPTATPDPAGHASYGLSKKVIAGIVVGAVAFLVICAALFFFVGRAKSLKEFLDQRDATLSPGTEHSGYPSPFSPEHHQAGPESHPFGWTSPHLGHMSMMSMSDQPQTSAVKTPHSVLVEMPSPGPTQQAFTAELEAPLKSPR